MTGMKYRFIVFAAILMNSFSKAQGIYEIVKIGNQTWMKKNLDVTTYRNGDPIPEVKDPKQWATLKTGAWCYYDNDSINGRTYGKLYNWYAVHDPRGLAPAGWHLPADKDWNELDSQLGGFELAGGKLKEKGTAHWLSPNTGATNSSGFTGLPGGYRYLNGVFYDIGASVSWWNTAEANATDAWARGLSYESESFGGDGGYKQNGFSVRCVKD
jgi:uncharacterized protein (TIGR02145 family)